MLRFKNLLSFYSRNSMLQDSFAERVLVNTYKWKHTLDFSKFPEIDEKDIVEQYIQGSGPGGSAVNKACNCVLLKHLPTGIIVKCHESRILQENGKIARERLRTKLDELLNGEMSITAQRRKIEKKKLLCKQYKGEKLRALKKAFKERENSENIVSDADF